VWCARRQVEHSADFHGLGRQRENAKGGEACGGGEVVAGWD
jgi:hypothetical protein